MPAAPSRDTNETPTNGDGPRRSSLVQERSRRHGETELSRRRRQRRFGQRAPLAAADVSLGRKQPLRPNKKSLARCGVNRVDLGQNHHIGGVNLRLRQGIQRRPAGTCRCIQQSDGAHKLQRTATLKDAQMKADEARRQALEESKKEIARAAMLAAEKILREKNA